MINEELFKAVKKGNSKQVKKVLEEEKINEKDLQDVFIEALLSATLSTVTAVPS
jgi:hypothetical protein